MGRTLVVRAFLFVAVALTLGSAGAADEPQKADEAEEIASTWDELESWLEQLCAVVKCEAQRSPEAQLSDAADNVAVRFVLAYEAYGIRQDLSMDERAYTRAAVRRALRLLTDGSPELDPRVRDALWTTLNFMREDLGEQVA